TLYTALSQLNTADVKIITVEDPVEYQIEGINQIQAKPQIGLDFTLRLDGLAWMFAGLVLGIGALVVLYARYYLSQQDNAHRFYCYLLLFMGA
ncbi:ATPase, T2SS/T4P/T4SS family, partial [Mesorhizobium sp. M2D.F.Ca.ET.153.01.1.1]|uniref:ATPase, T2SS/T4P/T4SS family n=1 Tax=Mesorhizobium sp. M2D.F.Ca.ET.153.01.1.1 TaxID=2500520 RepID=UPI001AED785D